MFCTEAIDVRSNLLKKRPRYAFALVQKRRKKMLVCDFRMIGLRSQILCRLQRLLHLLRVFVDAHTSTYEREGQRAIANGESAGRRLTQTPLQR